MKKWFKLLFVSLLMTLTMTSYAGTSSTPAGYWKTIDDVTNKPKSILEVTEQADHTLSGRVIKIYPRPGYDENEACTACQGERHNQRIVGMMVMDKMKQDTSVKNQWVNGEILDPLNGKTYHCRITLLKNGKELLVRGYIGIPLFGRSQTWTR